MGGDESISSPDIKHECVVVLGIAAKTVVVVACTVKLVVGRVLRTDANILQGNPERLVNKAVNCSPCNLVWSISNRRITTAGRSLSGKSFSSHRSDQILRDGRV